MQEYVAIVTAESVRNREMCRKIPYVAFLNEMLERVKQDFTESMRELCRQKIVEAHKDINGKVMFEFVKPK